MLYIYPTYFVIGLISKLSIKRANQYFVIPIVTLGSSVTFFILSNFGYFLKETPVYTWNALLQTYIDAIPFFQTEILATVIFTSLVFGYHNLLVK